MACHMTNLACHMTNLACHMTNCMSHDIKFHDQFGVSQYNFCCQTRKQISELEQKIEKLERELTVLSMAQKVEEVGHTEGILKVVS